MLNIKSEYLDLDKYANYKDILYYKKNTTLLHNPYGPAYICYNEYKEYWIEGKLHRLDGPAVIYEDGREEYLINHENLTKEQFEVHPERLKFLGKEHLACLG